MSRQKRSTDLPIVGLECLVLATVVQLLGVLDQVTWLAAGALVLPIIMVWFSWLWVATTCAGSHQHQRGDNTSSPKVPGAAVLTVNQRDAAIQIAIPVQDSEGWPLQVNDLEESSTLLQRWTRWVTGSGQESISGEILIEFSAGAKTSIVHIPWQPAFSGTPQVSVDVVAGEAEIQVDLVRPYGMRLSARRIGPIDLPATCRIEVFISQPAALRAAA